MNFLSSLWQVCEGLNDLKSFRLELLGSDLRFYFSSFWPSKKIEHALALNISKNTQEKGWKIYSLTSTEFDFSEIVNSFNRDQHGRLELKNNDEIIAFYDSLNHIFRVYDFKNERAAVIISAGHKFNEWELHSPLREFFHIWALKNNALLIHSGSVSKNGYAVLLPGAGGSGKSTTTLSCLQENMHTTGDDYNLIYKDGENFRICNVYSNVKLKDPKEGMVSFNFPFMENWQKEKVSYAEKTIYYPPEDSDIWDASKPKIAAIFCPRITGEKYPQLTEMRSAELINRLSVSSIMQSPIMAKEYLAMSVQLAKHMRIAYLDLSGDIKANANLIGEFLKNKINQYEVDKRNSSGI